MGWGETVSAELQGLRGKSSSPSNGKAFGKIGSGQSEACEETLIRRRTFMLDMGEGSREQGFKLNGCR